MARCWQCLRPMRKRKIDGLSECRRHGVPPGPMRLNSAGNPTLDTLRIINEHRLWLAQPYAPQPTAEHKSLPVVWRSR